MQRDGDSVGMSDYEGMFERCPWAIRFGKLATRCIDGAGHLGSSYTRKGDGHIGRGLDVYPFQRVRWLPGARREFMTERTDWYAWEAE